MVNEGVGVLGYPSQVFSSEQFLLLKGQVHGSAHAHKSNAIFRPGNAVPSMKAI